MPELPHLILPRAKGELERRKRQGFGFGVPRDQRQQAAKVGQQVVETLEALARLRASVVDPQLIVRVRTAVPITEEQWELAGLVVLGQDDKDSVVLFSSDGELTEFRRRLSSYAKPIPEGQQNPSFAGLIGAIEEFRPISPEDRIGPSLRDEGFNTVESFADSRVFLLDVELWDTGPQLQRAGEVDKLRVQLSEHSGEITDHYIGQTFTVLRVEGRGAAIRWLLGLPAVSIRYSQRGDCRDFRSK